MAFSRQLAVVGILGACFFVAVGCEDDDDKKVTGGAGEGGDTSLAGSGGSEQAGSPASAGDGGVAAGGGGAGNSVQGGEAGRAGGSGGGTGGAGEAGNAGEGGAVAAGGAAAAGGGGEGGGSVAAFKECAASCAQDADCAIEGNTALKCDPATNHCFDSTAQCEVHADCGPYFTFFLGCETAADCFDGSDSCVTWQGSGRCAFAAVDGDCDVGVPESFPNFGGDGSTVVCLNDQGRCGSDGMCFTSCALSTCDEDGGTCNTESGLCECASDSECVKGVCGSDGRCVECITSEDCADAEDGNEVCIDGKCGCGSADSCPDYGWPGATPVCE